MDRGEARMNGRILRELEAEARAQRKKRDMDLSKPAPVNDIADRQCGRGLANCAGTVIVHCPLCGRGQPAA